MSKLRARIFDRNRYAKRYPFIKGPKRLTYMGDSDLSIELGSIKFDNESEKIFTFEAPFVDANYVVVATPRGASASDSMSSQVSLAVDASSLDKFQVKILASAKFTGWADVLAVRVG